MRLTVHDGDAEDVYAAEDAVKDGFCVFDDVPDPDDAPEIDAVNSFWA